MSLSPEHPCKDSNQSSHRPAITVVGGSAAGFFAAYLLAREGRAVDIFEQSPRLDAAERTLIVTHRMKDLLGEAGSASIVNEVRKFELYTDGRAASVNLACPDLIIERAKLIQSLGEQAQRAGAQLHLGRNFRTLQAHGGKLTLEFQNAAKNENEERIADTVIAADGSSSSVAKAAGWPQPPAAPLIQAIVPLPKDMQPDTVRVWFVPDDTPYFYWLIPESSERGALGLIGESGSEARKHLEAFLEKRRLNPIAFQGARIPIYNRWVPIEKEFDGARVFLVGDAAAQVKVSTVGGIVTGLRGALGVAQRILNRGSSKELRRLRRELDLHLLIRRALHDFHQQDYSQLVDSLNSPAKHSLGQFSRDEALKLLWRVCLNQPRLVLMGLRGLLTGSRRFYTQNP